MSGRTQNLSLDGTFIRCADDPELDEIFRLVVRPPDRQLLVVTAEKVWSDTFIDDRFIFHGIGVQFVYVPHDDRRYLADLIASHFKKGIGVTH